MGASLNDLSVVKHTDLVSVLDGAQSVGDGHSGACLHQSFQRILYQSFTFSIECRSGLVEDKDRRILQNSSGDGYALALTTTESATSITYVGIEALF